MVGRMGRISHNLKIRMVVSKIATSKNHIELQLYCVVPAVRSEIRDPLQILVLEKTLGIIETEKN
jgi:hypothetical protein